MGSRQCHDQCCFRDPAEPVFIPENYSRHPTLRWPSPGWATRRPDSEGRKGRRNIDNEDGTGEHTNAKGREAQDQNVETAAHEASDDSRGGKAGTRRGTAAPENHKTCNNKRQSCREQGNDKDKGKQHRRKGDQGQEAEEGQESKRTHKEDTQGDSGGDRKGQDVQGAREGAEEEGEGGPGSRHRGQQRPLLLPPSRAQTGGGPRHQHSSAVHRYRTFRSAPP